MSVSKIPVVPGSAFQVSSDTWNQMLKSQQQLPPTGQSVSDNRPVAWVIARNQYKTSGGEEVDLMAGEGVRLQGPHQGNTADSRGLLWPPDPEKLDQVYAFRNQPVLQIFRQSQAGSTSGITLDSIPYGACGRVLIQGVHWCEVTGPRGSPNNWATVSTDGRGPLTVGSTGDFKLLGQWWPEPADINEPRTALVSVGQFGYVPQFNSEIRVNIWGPPTGGTWDLSWDLPAVTIDEVAHDPFTITLEDLAFDISAADLLQEIIDASSSKITSDDFSIAGSMLNSYRIVALSGGNYGSRFLKLPTLDITNLESVLLGSYCSFDQVGFLATGY